APSRPTIERVEVAEDGTLHVIDSGGKDMTFKKSKEVVAYSSPRVAEDRQTAGWLNERENCCTSYSIPISLTIYRSGRVLRYIEPGLMVYDWQFYNRGKQVVIEHGTVHARMPHLQPRLPSH